MLKKLVIGTAQFGLKYGLTNKTGKVNKNNAVDILNFAQKKNFFFLDTSREYGDSELKIGLINNPNWKIITKIDAKHFYKKNKDQMTKDILKKIKNSKKKLKVGKLYGLLIHNSDYLFKKKGEDIYKVLKYIKNVGLISKFGYSIYNFKDIKKICTIFKPDIIQCPLNIFDRRLLKNGNLKVIKKEGIELHIRSVFLQGLLLTSDRVILKKFYKWDSLFKKWNNWIKLKKFSKLEACLNYVNSIKGIDKILVGIDNIDQFKEIINLKFRKNFYCPNYLQSRDIKLINPHLW